MQSFVFQGSPPTGPCFGEFCLIASSSVIENLSIHSVITRLKVSQILPMFHLLKLHLPQSKCIPIKLNLC